MIWCELEFFPNGRDVRGEKTFYRMAQSAAGALFDFVVLSRGRHNFNVVHVPNTNDIDEEGVKNIQQCEWPSNYAKEMPDLFIIQGFYTPFLKARLFQYVRPAPDESGERIEEGEIMLRAEARPATHEVVELLKRDEPVGITDLVDIVKGMVERPPTK